VNLSDDEKRQALFCCAEELRARAAGKPPGVQPWLARLVRRLELEVAVSSSRHDDRDGSSRSKGDEWIGTAEAARILGWHPRRVQRHAADLDGRKFPTQLVFRESAVRDYAEGLTDGRRAG
jgi:hypothetical protein